MPQVILVDTNDIEIGTMEKMEAHQKGMLHRAFSVFVFNSKGEMLLQQRALSKYHSAGLWTNTCCSHPQQGEELVNAAQKRLKEEMGFSCDLNVKGKFIYKVELENNLTEHELDYVLTGVYNGPVFPCNDEVQNYKWIPPDDINQQIKVSPTNFTFWFKEIMNRFVF